MPKEIALCKKCKFAKQDVWDSVMRGDLVEKIKALQEENKQLKADEQEYQERLVFEVKRAEKLEKENKKLKEQIEKWKKNPPVGMTLATTKK